MSLKNVPQVKVSYQMLIYSGKSISITNHASQKARKKYEEAREKQMDEDYGGMREYECIEYQKVYIPQDEPYDYIKDIREGVERPEKEDMRRVNQSLRQRRKDYHDGKICLQCNPKACMNAMCPKFIKSTSDLKYLVWGYKFVDTDSDNPKENPEIKDEFEFETDNLEAGLRYLYDIAKQKFVARLVDRERQEFIAESHGFTFGVEGMTPSWLTWFDRSIQEQYPTFD